MSLHYLVDGYNIIKQAPALAEVELEQGRDGLLRWIDAQRPQGSVNNRVTVVFDGSSEHFGSPWAGTARVIFTKNESADERIKAMVEESSAKSNVVVVSDDRGITLYVRSLGARIMEVKEFAADLFDAPSGPSPQKGRGKYISLAKAKQINEELKKIWLK
ncbi:MAG: NYN domain-containing protein [Candidatus Omnitrophica bacterium]|nr:NYN domain-containing protein [Candidatus Omnitrophota bacterium]